MMRTTIVNQRGLTERFAGLQLIVAAKSVYTSHCFLNEAQPPAGIIFDSLLFVDVGPCPSSVQEIYELRAIPKKVQLLQANQSPNRF